MVKIKGWIKEPLGNIGNFSKGCGVKKADANSGHLPCIRYGEIYTKHNDYIRTFFSRISLDVASESRLLKKGELLFSASGETKEEIGKCVAFIDDIEAYAGGDIIILTPTKEINSLFFGYLLNTLKIVKQKANRGQGDAVVHITSKSLSEIEIYYPKCIKEQSEIAKVLSDTDEYIAALEKLIEKKKAIKTGTMQELLTCKRRLKGFTGKWVEKQIGKLGDFYSGLTGKTAKDFGTGNAKYITFLNVLSNTAIDTSFLGSVLVSSSEKQNLVSKGDLFFNTSSETPTEVGMCAALLDDLTDTYLNSFCFGMRLTDSSIDALFLSYYFNSNIGRKIMTVLAQGATRYNLTKSYFSETIIIVPEHKEQTAIAEVLSDMDAEIEALSAKLQKAKALKIGMMQQLLTGQIRLVEVATGDSRLEDAVVISGIVDIWGREQKYPLGRVKVAKLFYLYTRKVDGDISRFHEHAAGPYDETVRHGGGEVLATQSGYIEIEDRGDSSKFSCGENIEEAKKQLYDFDAVGTLKWLDDNFRMTSKEELELLATVDLARLRLEQTGRTADVQSVYDYISQSTDWAAKLDRADFHISNIAKALKQSRELFGQGGQA